MKWKGRPSSLNIDNRTYPSTTGRTVKRSEIAKKRSYEAQEKMDISTNYPAGREKQSIGSRGSRNSGGRGRWVKQKSKTGHRTGGGF
jgi:hypothetical protein